jgi:hypothetical protein
MIGLGLGLGLGLGGVVVYMIEQLSLLVSFTSDIDIRIGIG